ncbi:MAG: prephenate dehydrogenase/arogenate dehydrogenase family protein [Desulfobacterales bacterium]
MSRTTIGIVGGTGHMGQWFRQFFTDAGHQVLISGRKTTLTTADLAEKSDIVILSIPMDAAATMAEKIGPLLRKDQLLMDFCSLKEGIIDVMKRSTEAEVIGTHPLFGPFTDSLEGQNIILCPARGTRWLRWLETEFESKGAIVTRMDPVEHDRNMAVVQGLNHLLTVSLARTLQKLGMPPDQALLYSTPVFRMKMDLVGRLFAQDLDLYKNLIGKNRFTLEALDAFSSALSEGKEALLSGQDDSATAFLAEIQTFLGDFSHDRLDESNRMLNALPSGGPKRPAEQK